MLKKVLDKLTVVRNQKGFTLVEMLLILVVLGIIAAIVIGYISNPMKEASVGGAVTQIGDNMRTVADAGDLFYASKTTPIASLTDLTSGAAPQLKTVPVAPSQAKDSTFAGTYAYTFVNNSATYKDWGDTAVNDAVLVLAGVSLDVCKGINAKFAGLAPTAVPPTAIVATKDLQCWKNGSDYTVVKVVYTN